MSTNVGVPETAVKLDPEQIAHNKKIEGEVTKLLAEAEKAKVYISAETRNPEAIRKEIDRVLTARARKGQE
jgi:hypothetical protein